MRWSQYHLGTENFQRSPEVTCSLLRPVPLRIRGTWAESRHPFNGDEDARPASHRHCWSVAPRDPQGERMGVWGASWERGYKWRHRGAPTRFFRCVRLVPVAPRGRNA